MDLTSPLFGPEEMEMLKNCLDSKWVTQGPITKEFEDLICARQEVKHALATTSCTAALHLSVLSLNVEPEDEVIVPAFTWITSANAAEYVGAKAVFVDIDPLTYNLDATKLESAISSKTRAIIVVHLFGLAAEMDPIMKIANRHGLAVIEDAACAIGTTYNGEAVGGIGTLGCFSFHPRKVITTGEGGCVTTNNADLAASIVSLRNHGATGLPDSTQEDIGPWTMATFKKLGFNLRLSDIQSAVGVAQFAKLDMLLKERRRLALNYSELLGHLDGIAVPTRNVNSAGHTFQSYVIRVLEGGRKKRNQIMQNLADNDIASRPGTHAVHKLEYYASRYNLKSDDYPIAAQSEDQTITLPLFPGMTEEQQNKVVSVLTSALL